MATALTDSSETGENPLISPSLISVATQPPGMLKRLFPHQLMAIDKMEERERDRQITSFHYEIDLQMGIYADMVGFGKTVTMIGLMLRNRMPWDLQQDYVQASIINVYGNGCIVKRLRTFFQRIRANLVVATITVAFQWIQELKETDLRSILITSRKLAKHIDPTEYDVVVATPACYNAVTERFPNYAWKRFIYDDPTHCRIPSMRPIVAGYIWMLSATPEMLLYQHRTSNHFMSTIFCSYLDYNIYKHLIIKNDDVFVRQSYALPPLIDIVHECHEPVVWIIRDLISPSVLDMVSAGDIQGAVRAMGGTTTSNLYDLVIREKIEARQQAEWKIAKFQRLHDLPRMEKWILRRQLLQDELTQLHNRLSKVMEEDKCHICFDRLREPVVLTCCQNIFCGKCILQWISSDMNLSSVCPLCRRHLTSDHLVYMKKTSLSENPPLVGSGCGEPTPCSPQKNPDSPLDGSPCPSKIDVLRQILCSYPEGRFIIFSSYDETFQRLRQVFIDMDCPYGELQGRNDSRCRTIQEFRKGTLRVLFLNSIQHGAGDNLQEATDVILYHEMNDLMKMQIIGRAYRIGRSVPLRVHHLQTGRPSGGITAAVPQPDTHDPSSRIRSLGRGRR